MNFSPYQQINQDTPCDLCGDYIFDESIFKTDMPNYLCLKCLNHLLEMPADMERHIEDYISGNVL